MIVKGEVGQSGMNWDFGASGCKLLCLEWINNKVLLYSTGNYIQFPGIDCDGKEYFFKKCMYMYDQITLLYSKNWHIVNQLCFSKKKKSKK